VAAARANYDLGRKESATRCEIIESGDVSRLHTTSRKRTRRVKETYQAALAQARQNFAAVAVARSNVANAQSQVNLARRALAYTVVTSPIDGFVADRPVDAGEYVTTTTK